MPPSIASVDVARLTPSKPSAAVSLTKGVEMGKAGENFSKHLKDAKSESRTSQPNVEQARRTSAVKAKATGGTKKKSAAKVGGGRRAEEDVVRGKAGTKDDAPVDPLTPAGDAIAAVEEGDTADGNASAAAHEAIKQVDPQEAMQMAVAPPTVGLPTERVPGSSDETTAQRVEERPVVQYAADAADSSQAGNGSESRVTAEAQANPVGHAPVEKQIAKTKTVALEQQSQDAPVVSPLDETGPVTSKAVAQALKGMTPEDLANARVQDSEGLPVPAAVKEVAAEKGPDAMDVLGKFQVQPGAAGVVAEAPAHFATAGSAPQQPQVPAEAHFAQANHASIISGVRSALLPHGGSMQIRLDPPELGALQVSVEMRDGVMNATFQTSNEEATRLLSHSLGQLKSALESQGVTVEKIQVQQAPRDQQSQNSEDHRQQGRQFDDDRNAQQEQQRREVLRRMWRRVSGGHDPVDLVA